MAISIPPPTPEISSRKQPKNLWTYSSTLRCGARQHGEARVPGLVAILEVLHEEPAWWDGWSSAEAYLAATWGPLTMREIAAIVGVSRARVAQLLAEDDSGALKLASSVPRALARQVREELQGAEEERDRARVQGHRMRVRAR